MMYNEFCDLIGMRCSADDYDKIYEPMYLAAPEEWNKEDFANFIRPAVVQREVDHIYKEDMLTLSNDWKHIKSLQESWNDRLIHMIKGGR